MLFVKLNFANVFGCKLGCLSSCLDIFLSTSDIHFTYATILNSALVFPVLSLFDADLMQFVEKMF